MEAEPHESQLNDEGERLRDEYVRGVRDFSNRQIADVRLVDTDFAKCDFAATRFTNCVLGGVTFNDGTFDGARFERCNVSGSRFQRASLRHAVFNPSVFRGADFFQASLSGADFLNCDASGAYFGLADLRDASLYGGAFVESWFLMTNLKGSTLVGANFENARVLAFNLIDAETLTKNGLLLRQTLGQRKHLNDALARATPVTMSLATVIARGYLDEGQEPMPIDQLPAFIERLDKQFEHLRRFLLASGCNPQEVARMGQAADKQHADYPRVFISYSSADEELATHLYASLTAFGVDAWFAPEKMQGGRKINEQIEEAIAERDKLILVLSEASMNSRWVASELQWAAAREISSGQQILFPIRIVPFEAVRQWTLFDADVGQDVAKYVRQYFVPDFSAWRDGEALARLTERFLRDLRLSYRT